MPIYEYECGSCHYRFELKQGFDADPDAECPQCSEKSRRVAFVCFHCISIYFRFLVIILRIIGLFAHFISYYLREYRLTDILLHTIFIPE